MGHLEMKKIIRSYPLLKGTGNIEKIRNYNNRVPWILNKEMLAEPYIVLEEQYEINCNYRLDFDNYEIKNLIMMYSKEYNHALYEKYKNYPDQCIKRALLEDPKECPAPLSLLVESIRNKGLSLSGSDYTFTSNYSFLRKTGSYSIKKHYNFIKTSMLLRLSDLLKYISETVIVKESYIMIHIKEENEGILNKICKSFDSDIEVKVRKL